MDLSTLKTNKDAALKGKWIDFDDSRILIAASNTPEIKKAIRKRMAKFPPHLVRDFAPSVEEAQLKIWAKHVLLSWENLSLEGEPIEPTEENRFKVLKEIQDFRDWVEMQATDSSNFRTEVEAESEAALKSGDPLDA